MKKILLMSLTCTIMVLSSCQKDEKEEVTIGIGIDNWQEEEKYTFTVNENITTPELKK